MLGTKYLIVEVLKCDGCGLIFIWPQEEPGARDRYYQMEYASPMVTDLPTRSELSSLIESGFDKPGLDLSKKIQFLKTLRPSGRILDFGCSWGYGTYQLQVAGFDAVGFEISKPRARFGREKLHLRIVDDLDALRGPEEEQQFDIIFSNHVLEHMSDLHRALELFSHLLRNGGIMLHFLPNLAEMAGSSDDPWRGLHRAHPVAPTRQFFEKNLPKYGFRVMATGPVTQASDAQPWLSRTNSNVATQSEKEFLVVASRI